MNNQLVQKTINDIIHYIHLTIKEKIQGLTYGLFFPRFTTTEIIYIINKLRGQGYDVHLEGQGIRIDLRKYIDLD